MKDKYENERIEQLFRAAMLEVAKIESEKLEQEALNPAFLPSKKFNRKIERMIGIKAEKRNWKLSFQKLYAGYNRLAGWVVIAVFLIYLFFHPCYCLGFRLFGLYWHLYPVPSDTPPLPDLSFHKLFSILWYHLP